MKTRFFTAGLMTALLTLWAVSPQAMAQWVSSTNPEAVKAGTYRVEPFHTQVGFAISHFGFTVSGLFSGASGRLQYDPANVSVSRLEFSIPVHSLRTTVPPLSEQLKGKQWFDAARFPTVTFTSTQVTVTGKDAFTIVGNLTLHGVTKPVTLNARLVGSSTNPLDKAVTVGFKATGTIKRSDFDLKQYLSLLGDEVRLTIDGAFELQQ
jgi:polyisoprenoid-binding protein YceI